MEMSLYYSDTTGNKKNVFYPRPIIIRSVEDLKQVVPFDHVAALYKENHRKNKHFIKTDTLMMDCDNGDTDNHERWVTVDDVKHAFPRVVFYAVYSRSHMQVKNGKSARPRFHVYFPIDTMTNHEAYRLFKEAVIAHFPALDKGAKDAARFFYGVDDPQVEFHSGDINLTVFMKDRQEPHKGEPKHKSQPRQDQTEHIDGSTSYGKTTLEKFLKEMAATPQGQRNSTLNILAFRLGQLVGKGEIDAASAELLKNTAYKLADESFTIEDIDATFKSGFEAGLEKERDVYLKTAAIHYIPALRDLIASEKQVVKSGFNNLDEALDGGLFEGLYFFGAVSSLGKTTFLLQITDQIARAGQDVLFFSLEMGRFELMAKSISRLTVENCNGNTRNAKTMRGILEGVCYTKYSQTEKNLITESIKKYSDFAPRIFFQEGVGNIDVVQIRREVERHIRFTGNAPVVFIDYLQVIAPTDHRATDKHNIDTAVLELKRLSRDHRIPIVAISSFNRDNYNMPVNFASFKESGAIEYSSDVLLGMQFAEMGDLKYSSGKLAENITKIEGMKQSDPREVEIKVLKNRNGKIGVNLYYNFYPLFNLFKETDFQEGN